MRVAALYDIHGNLPALEAVLDELRRASVDEVVVGGDVVPGPMPRETLRRLLDLGIPTRFLYGNGERAVLAQRSASDPATVTYWGTASGQPLPPSQAELLRWSGRQLGPEDARVMEQWSPTHQTEISGLGRVLFCHATPRNETEIFTRVTPVERLRPIFDQVDAPVVVCGHTHMPFDRMVNETRVVNAGSIGMPFGRPGADWLVLGPDVEPRHTAYDLETAAERVRHTTYPQADEFARSYIQRPPSEEAMLEAFGAAELTP